MPERHFRDFVVPLVAVLSMALAVVLFIVVLLTSTGQTAANCRTNVRFWATFQHVITATENPPTLAGRSVTPAERSALLSYGEHLRTAVGSRPVC